MKFEVSGLVFIIGLGLYIASFFVGSRDAEAAVDKAEPAAA